MRSSAVTVMICDGCGMTASSWGNGGAVHGWLDVHALGYVGAHHACSDECSTVIRLDAVLDELHRLEGDELELVEALLWRLHLGRHEYGPWNLDDGLDYRVEATEEVLDLAIYLAAQLAREKRIGKNDVQE